MNKKRPRSKKRFPHSNKVNPPFQVGIWDIETSDLKANLGIVISSGIKIVGGKTIVHVNKNLKVDGLDDKQICLEVKKSLEQLDIIVSFYGLGFDLKMLNSRLMFWGEMPVRPILHLDLYRLGKRYFNTTRRNLETITQHLGIQGKNHVDLSVWMKAKINGDEIAIKYIVDHMVRDLDITEKLFLRLKPLIKSISLA